MSAPVRFSPAGIEFFRKREPFFRGRISGDHSAGDVLFPEQFRVTDENRFETGEDNDLVTVRVAFRDQVFSVQQFRRDVLVVFKDDAGIDAKLPQSGQTCQNRDPAVRSDAAPDVFQGRQIQRALAVVHCDDDVGLGQIRQILDDVFFETSQDERLDQPGDPPRGLRFPDA